MAEFTVKPVNSNKGFTPVGSQIPTSAINPPRAFRCLRTCRICSPAITRPPVQDSLLAC